MARLSPFIAVIAAGALCSTVAMSHAGLAMGLAHFRPEAPPAAAASLSSAPAATAEPTRVSTPIQAETAIASLQATPTQTALTRAAGAQATPAAVESLPRQAPAGLESYEEKSASLFDRMNGARTKDGEAALKRDIALDEVALARANNLVANSYFDHYAPDGESAFTELADRGIRYRLAGENLARNNYSQSRTAAAAFDGLMASPGHRANILEPRFSRAGVATVRANGMWIYVSVFMD